ncbi:MAG: kinase [Kiritimatiellae bacterium]|nr:kinase [Kiritimatiellia bacterium]
MIIARTPFRISFFGGGTDYPQFYEKYGGATLSAAINRYCYISIHELSPFFDYRFRASYARVETVNEPEQFQHPLIRECLRFLNIREGIEIAHVADLPGQTGIGSSSSFTVGLLHALHVFRGERVDCEQLAREAIVVEREKVGDVGGHQDQYAAAYGGILRIDYGPGRTVQVRQLQVSKERVAEFSRCFALFYTGVSRSAQSIAREQLQGIPNSVAILAEMRDMVYEAEAILTGNSSFIPFGQLLHKSWELKKTLAPGITTPLVEDAYARARSAGALGGKLLGSGGRGFLLIFGEPDCLPKVRQSLSDLAEVTFRIGAPGSHILFREE